MNIVLLLGAVLGLSSVMIAAYVDHSLAATFSVKALSSVLNAVRYHQLYALLITLIGICLPIQSHYRHKIWLRRTAVIFIVGIILFSGSIYVAYIAGMMKLLNVTPIGGLTLVLGWGSLVRVAFLYRNN